MLRSTIEDMGKQSSQIDAFASPDFVEVNTPLSGKRRIDLNDYFAPVLNELIDDLVNEAVQLRTLYKEFLISSLTLNEFARQKKIPANTLHYRFKRFRLPTNLRRNNEVD